MLTKPLFCNSNYLYSVINSNYTTIKLKTLSTSANALLSHPPTLPLPMATATFHQYPSINSSVPSSREPSLTPRISPPYILMALSLSHF